MELEEAIVLYPSPGMGHLISLVEFAKLILSHHTTLSVHVLIPPAPYVSASSTAPYVSAVSAAIPSIKFHPLPPITLPPETKHDLLTIQVLRLSNPHVHQTLLQISQSHTVQAFIIDFFCTCSLPVASDLHIPTYYYYTSAAGILATSLYLPALHRATTKSFKELGHTVLDIPGIPQIPARDMPEPLQDRHDKIYEYLLEVGVSLAKSAGVIINTFEALEPRALNAIRDGSCTPTAVPVHCVGPVIASEEQRSGFQVHECVTWLDSQPSGSVIFLCFGSLGVFSREQLAEIGHGLENSGQRFLWVVRNPHGSPVSGHMEPEDLESLLPEGFLERTKDRGLVVRTWAPQVTVLNHGAVGGFVTHCGWNSILEAASAGVPMVAWPLYAGQKINRALIVQEMGIAIPMEMEQSLSEGFVRRKEVEKRVRELMGSETGRPVRERTAAMREAAKAATSEGGSSRAALVYLVNSWKRRSSRHNL